MMQNGPAECASYDYDRSYGECSQPRWHRQGIAHGENDEPPPLLDSASAISLALGQHLQYEPVHALSREIARRVKLLCFQVMGKT